MAKTKSKMNIAVAGGAGGLVDVEDHRFDRAGWPINFEIPVEDEQADRWPQYLSDACHRRGWSSGALSQIERAENSGTITIAASASPQLEIVWERRRGRPIKVQARPAQSSGLTIAAAEEFLHEVNDRCHQRVTEPIYARGTLEYEGLAWRGELWLDDKVRLAPPSRQDETATLGPRIIHADVMLDCIGRPDVPHALHQFLLELSAFLSVVMRTSVRRPEQGRVWTWAPEAQESEVRNLGYMERANPLAMPVRGAEREVPLYHQDDAPLGITVTSTEVAVRQDTSDLWALYRSLGRERRLQFMQAATKWQEAMGHWRDRPSLSFALMVVACEALKPPDTDERQNCYDVIERLLGPSVVDVIRQNTLPAQRVRNAHLHSGRFHGSELVTTAFFMSYEDPTFGQAHRAMAQIAPAAIVEWLRRGGVFDIPIAKKRRTIRRWLRDNVALVSTLAFGIGLLVGWVARIP